MGRFVCLPMIFQLVVFPVAHTIRRGERVQETIVVQSRTLGKGNQGNQSNQSLGSDVNKSEVVESQDVQGKESGVDKSALYSAQRISRADGVSTQTSANRSTVFADMSIVAQNLTIQSRTSSGVVCFGLCIAIGGASLALWWLVPASSVGLYLVGNGARSAVLWYLEELQVSSDMIKQTVSDAAKFAKSTDEEITAPLDRLHMEAVTPVPWTSHELLHHISDTCGAYMKLKGLGESETSSKSGAVFWNCKTPSVTADYRRMLVKGAIRDGIDAPEWQKFGALAREGCGDDDEDPCKLTQVYSRPTLLNKMLLGFDAYDMHWLVLEDVKADALMRRLQDHVKIPEEVFEGCSEDGRCAYDIKPVGNRAPQLPACFQHLMEVTNALGPVSHFEGWERITSIMKMDLELLKDERIIDESLYVQVWGPFDVDEASIDKKAVERFFENEDVPVCAYKIEDGQMAIVCISILDYLLSFTFLKNVQNVLQLFRWNSYEDKMLSLLDCVGNPLGAGCADFKRQADGYWQEMVQENYATLATDPKFVAAMERVTDSHRCCCATQGGPFTMDTACAWLRRSDQVTSWGFCPGDLTHQAVSKGGCMDIEPPPQPPAEPEEPKTRCNTLFHYCCCVHLLSYETGYELPPEDHDQCGCKWSCSFERQYDPVTHCPVKS